MDVNHRALTPAERQQRRRARVRDGKRCIRVEVDEALLEDALLAGGFLTDIGDSRAVASALGRAIHAWSEEQLARYLLDGDVTRDDTGFRFER
jgi:hypothetical protein